MGSSTITDSFFNSQFHKKRSFFRHAGINSQSIIKQFRITFIFVFIRLNLDRAGGEGPLLTR